MKENPEAKEIILSYFTPEQEKVLKRKIINGAYDIAKISEGLLTVELLIPIMSAAVCEAFKYHQECQKGEMVLRE